MSAAGSKRVNVVHRKLIALRAARAGSSVRTTAASRRTPGARARRAAAPRIVARSAGPPTTRQPPQKTRTSVTSAGGGSAARKLARQLAHRIAEPEPHALRALVDRRARCSRACPSRGSRTRRGRSRGSRARQHVLERRAEVLQVDGLVGQRAGTWSARAGPRRGCGTRCAIASRS